MLIRRYSIGNPLAVYPFREWIGRREEMKKNILERHMDVDIDDVIELYSKYKRLVGKIGDLRREKRSDAETVTKEDLKSLVAESLDLKTQLGEVAAAVPNWTKETNRGVVFEHGNPEIGSVSYLDINERLGIFDVESGAKTSGKGFFFWKNQGLLLELGLVQYALSRAIGAGFRPVMVPDTVREEHVERCGFVPRGNRETVFGIGDGLVLSGTSELPLAIMHSNERLSWKDLPVRYVGFSHCFRKEGGGFSGIYRVAQFSKVELFGLAEESRSESLFDEIVSLEKKMFSELGLVFRGVLVGPEELGLSACVKIDIEGWMPGSRKWGEISSASNCTDFQSRRLWIRHGLEGSSELGFPHTVNGTALAVPRIVIALLERGYQADGSVVLPECLRPFLSPLGINGTPLILQAC